MQVATKHLSLVKQRAAETSYCSLPSSLLAGLEGAGAASVNGGAVDLWGAVTATMLCLPSLRSAAGSRALHQFKGLTLDRELLDLSIPAVFGGLPFTKHASVLSELMIIPTVLGIARVKFPSKATVSITRKRRHRQSPVILAEFRGLSLVESAPPANAAPLPGERYLLGGMGQPSPATALYRYETWELIDVVAQRYGISIRWHNDARPTRLADHVAALAKRVQAEYSKRSVLVPGRPASVAAEAGGPAGGDAEEGAVRNGHGGAAAVEDADDSTPEPKVPTTLPTPGPELDILVPYYGYLYDFFSRAGAGKAHETAMHILQCVLSDVVVFAEGTTALVFTAGMWKGTRALQLANVTDWEQDAAGRADLMQACDQVYLNRRKGDIRFVRTPP